MGGDVIMLDNLLQDEKYLLKFHTGSGVVTGGGRDDAKKIHSPVIKFVETIFAFSPMHLPYHPGSQRCL